MDVATDIAAHAALMGFSVQLFETLAWVEALLEPRPQPTSNGSRALYTAAGYACFIGRPDAARATRTGPLSSRSTQGTTRANRATRCSSKRSARCTAETSIATSSSLAWSRSRYGADRGYGLASYVDGLQSAGRIEEALALTEESVAAARELGNPYWISYALWIAGLAFSKADTRRALAAWDEGVAFVREHRVQFFEGFIARDAARLHTSDGEPEVALVLFAEAITAFHRVGNVPQLIITLASVPALFERLDRFEAAATLLGAMSQEPSSFNHVPELAELEGRLATKLGAERAGELTSAGAGLDLNDAAVYARQQIDAARRDPTSRARRAARRPRSPRARGAAPGRGRPHLGRDRDGAVHLVAHGRAPRPEHLHEARRLQPRRRRHAGRPCIGSWTAPSPAEVGAVRDRRGFAQRRVATQWK